jgi:hypothetical protein
MCLCLLHVIAEQPSSFGLQNMNRLGYITDGDNVYCAVRTGYLNEIGRVTLKESSAMGQAVNAPLSQRTREFHLRSVHVRFVIYKVVL